ncbi:hypothetical protein H1R17_11530 [Flavobacterium sp. xlx-214]|uniref:hypothetical protein n=1 Tax=unclassified Flavobacterium TaxID=196869 RepID=UPI0013CFD5FE|nr:MULTISPECIES: hypothetical protein [unclassified Flavobacterium]MBA5791847.1 hypothetical protein [Flavobacterium sp. xlx-221]QMI83084.1 hypothetical protein H1R17_11530 [Flavobacterium sp. xlx-214]
MKKIFLLSIGLLSFYGNAQQKEFSFENSSKPKTQVVRSVILEGSSTSYITVSGSTSTEKLKEIEQIAKEHGIDIKFTNEKYNRNQLEYIELSYLTNQKWETITFGTADLKLLPFDVSFGYKLENNQKNKQFTLKNNKNNRQNSAEEINFQII